MSRESWTGTQGILRNLVLALCLVAAAPLMAEAADFTITGRFLYEDRIWDQFGYTGVVQNLPIRHADIEVIKDQGQGQILASGSTDADGNYSIFVTGQGGNINLYVRCLSSSDSSSTYHIKVVDTFTRSGGTVDLGGSSVHAITTSTVGHDTSGDLDMGDYLTADIDGFGVVQAFNIFDNAVDSFDYLNTAGGIGRYPTAGEFVVYGWGPPAGSTGSNYFWQGIFITGNENISDTDGWSDTVILHETGHWASDMFGRDDNPGGSHTLQDNNQDPRLSYGEGYATFFCAQVREFRAPRLNLSAQPVDDHVSIYADLGVPPSVGVPGGLEFAYDFETGEFQNGVSLGQVGTANETNVTSVLWDLVDGVTTPDETPGVDDEAGDEAGNLSWDVIQNYMTTVVSPANWITVEDFYEGWFLTHGTGFMQGSVDSSFVLLGCMKFLEDLNEPDDDFGSATPQTVLNFSSTPGSGIKINEVDLGGEDKIEFMNTDTLSVSMTGWTVWAYRNGQPDTSYVFPEFTLHPGCIVVLHESGSSIFNGPAHLYAQMNFVWANGIDGAITLEDSTGAAQDFLRWDTIGGDPSSTPVPPGTGWSGSLESAPGGKNLARDKNGADTDIASDWSNRDPSMGSPNFSAIPLSTIYPGGDVDFVSVTTPPGALLVIQVEAPHSAGEPEIQLFDSGGELLGTESATHGFNELAEIQFLVGQDTTFVARVTHVGPYTNTAPYSMRVFTRPETKVLNAPVAVSAIADNASDSADTVRVSWLNGGEYDIVGIFRDGNLRASLTGNSTSYQEVVPRGTYEYGVLGSIDGALSELTETPVFAGIVSCYLSDSLEVDTSNFDLDPPWDRVNTIAESGTWSLHDSPGGDYANNVNISALQAIPVHMNIVSTLEFDHICVTEAGFDFGIVEISTDFGGSWSELARYDMNDHPEWADGVAGPGDWIHEQISLEPYLGDNVVVRFRLHADAFVTEDGWYIDNVNVSESSCGMVTAVPEELKPRPTALLAVTANPFASRLRFSLSAEAGVAGRAQVFDAQGRLVATVFEGALTSDRMDLVWDGRNRAGRPAASGFYLLRAQAGRRTEVQRVVKLP